MTTIQMKTKHAIEHIKQGKSVQDVILTDLEEVKLGFRDALLLTEHGFVVPSGNIAYQESDVEYDPDFDEVEWEGNYRSLSDLLVEEGAAAYKADEIQSGALTIKIAVADQEVRQWIEQNRPKLNELVEKLVVDLYHTDQMLHSK